MAPRAKVTPAPYAPLEGWMPPPPGVLTRQLQQAERVLEETRDAKEVIPALQDALTRARDVRDALIMLSAQSVGELTGTLTTARQARIYQIRAAMEAWLTRRGLTSPGELLSQPCADLVSRSDVAATLTQDLQEAEENLLRAEAAMADVSDLRRTYRRARYVRDALIMLNVQGATELAEFLGISRSRISQIRNDNTKRWLAQPHPLGTYIQEAINIRARTPGLSERARQAGRDTQKRQLIDAADPDGKLPPAERAALADDLVRQSMAEKGRTSATSRWRRLLDEVDPQGEMSKPLREAHARALRHQRSVKAGLAGSAARGRVRETAVTHEVAVTAKPPLATCTCGWPGVHWQGYRGAPKPPPGTPDGEAA